MKQLRWWGHLQTMGDNIPVKQIWESKVIGKRRRSRPQRTWEILMKRGTDWREAKKLALNKKCTNNSRDRRAFRKPLTEKELRYLAENWSDYEDDVDFESESCYMLFVTVKRITLGNLKYIVDYNILTMNVVLLLLSLYLARMAHVNPPPPIHRDATLRNSSLTITNELVMSVSLRQLRTNHKRPTLDRMFASTSQRNDDGLRASYNISLLIAKSGKPHTIGEKLILPAVEEVLKTVLHKPASDIIKRIPLSSNTVERRIDEMSSDI
ncbi:unnamed protein product [Acanthoscelides obtectus]|uniref:Uncharacterized protein n=1 Tax=Acanthoscelides obtectus TaxID=200917 RepID=A0A9P0KZE8_ACAOB|nr:unnamed protein product [Acanthoscelides obtectus]CAK1644027.1 Protein ZBED8 [Acanthoscelides obtectus]